MIPIELFKPIFSNIHDKYTLVRLSTLCKALQPTVESLLWTRLNLLRTYANNNPAQSTKKLELIHRRTGKYVRRLELSLGFIIQWAQWERTGGDEGFEDISTRLLEILNSMVMTEQLRLIEMDDRSAPPQIATLMNHLHFPGLKQLYYTGAFKPGLQEFLDRHPRAQTLFIGADNARGAHELLATHKLNHHRFLLPNLTALETTVPIFHAILPLLDPSTPLHHVTVSFGYHGSLSYLHLQLNHLLAQNTVFTNPATGKLEGLVFPSVRKLWLEKLTDEVYPDALQCLLPRFPNLSNIGNVYISAASSYRLVPILPSSLLQIDMKYEGIMWEAEFARMKATLKDKCNGLKRIGLWAWSEAYYDFWGCIWGDKDDGEVWNARPHYKSAPGNPAALWL